MRKLPVSMSLLTLTAYETRNTSDQIWVNVDHIRSPSMNYRPELELGAIMRSTISVVLPLWMTTRLLQSENAPPAYARRSYCPDRKRVN